MKTQGGDCEKQLIKPPHKALDFSMCGKLESPLTGTKPAARATTDAALFSFDKERAL
jgi:hypothetical protein